jgi:eukaryotic-like serine/threonine-protein kinase
MASFTDFDPLIGKTLGSYRVDKLIGAGGMGSVYLGLHPEIESKVAIKLLLPQFLKRETIVKRFLDEARATNRIQHPGIVKIHDAGTHEEHGVYLVMEYLEGETLQDLAKREGPLRAELVCRLMQQAASALAASHAVGIVHRDLKPANVFLVPDADIVGGVRVKVLDFGIAKLMEAQDPMAGGATETGAFLGSPMYMSPEQCVDSKDVDARADVYGLGAIAYHILSGRHPFETESLGRLVLMQRDQKPMALREHNPDVPLEVEAVVSRALAAERKDRFQSMVELRAAFMEAVGMAESGTAVPALAAPSMSWSKASAADDDLPATRMEKPTAAAAVTPVPVNTTLSGTTGESRPRGGGRALPLGLAAAAALVAVVIFVTRQMQDDPPTPATHGAATAAPNSVPEPDQGALSGRADAASVTAVAPDAAPPDAARPAVAKKPTARKLAAKKPIKRPTAKRPAVPSKPTPAIKKPTPTKKPAAKKPAVKPKKPFFDDDNL